MHAYWYIVLVLILPDGESLLRKEKKKISLILAFFPVDLSTALLQVVSFCRSTAFVIKVVGFVLCSSLQDGPSLLFHSLFVLVALILFQSTFL